MKTNWPYLIIGIAIILTFTPLLYGQTEGLATDQVNDYFGYYFYDRPLAWQSFTAGEDGFLAAVQLYAYTTNGASWTATFEVREGEGTAGALLASQSVSGDGNQLRTFVLATPLRQRAGDVYTFVLRAPSTAITVRASANNYAAGRCHHSSYDYNFKTWVLASDWAEEEWRDTSFTASSNVIGTAAQLAQFAWLVNNGTTFAGQTITLAADIDLGAHYWVPVGGWDNHFAGIFNGAGHSVRGLCINRPADDYLGLFGITESDAALQNLTVTNFDVLADSYSGGVVGQSFGVVTNCSAYGRIVGQYLVGGVAGCAEGALLACVNRAAVSGYGNVGGVAGLALGALVRCRNSGAVSGDDDVGGVAGYSGGAITSCANSGAVAANEGNFAGGVVGECYGDIYDCRNSGNVSGSATVGGIVGYLWEGSVDRCFNSGSVIGAIAGGIAGQGYGTVRNCVNSGAIDIVEDGYEAGGVVGYIWGESASVMNCANTGSVNGFDELSYVGGLVGWIDGCVLANSFNSGAVGGGGAAGGLVGYNGDESTLSNSYWKRSGIAPFALDYVGEDDGGMVYDCRSFDAPPGILAAPATVDGLTTDNLPDALNAWVAMTRDNDHLPLRRWTPGTPASYPTIIADRWSDAGNYSTNWYSASGTQFQIGTAAELAGLAVLVNTGNTFYNKQITLTDDIDLCEHEWTSFGRLNQFYNPVDYFGGLFDGAGRSVLGVYIDRPADDYQGLFGITGADVILQNLTVTNIDIVAASYSGGMVGRSYGVVTNCSAYGRVAGTSMVGGVAGCAEGGLSACVNHAKVSGENSVGGVAGTAYGAMARCCNSGAVSGVNNVGGVVGYTTADIFSCDNSGKVTANEGERAGGVAGACDGDIFDCRNSGNVSGPSTAGGIVGDQSIRDVDRCFNSGAVSGAPAGGIAGQAVGAIRNCVNSGAIDVVEDGYEAGGIVGYVYSWGSVMNCVNSGSMSGMGEWCHMGGIAGWNAGCMLANNVNSGAVGGDGTAGGLVGYNEDGELLNSYWKWNGSAPFDLDAVGEDDGGVVSACRSFGTPPGILVAPVMVDGLTTDSLPDALNAWMAMTRDNEHLPLRRWTPGTPTIYPTIITGRWSDTGNYSTNWYSEAGTQFQIGTAADLAGLAVLVNAGNTFYNKRITLTDDIDLREHEWTPIGWLDEAGVPAAGFEGTFDGNGKTVAGVYVDKRSERMSAGFFGAADGTIVANLALADADVAGDLCAGAMFGYLGFGWVINNACGGRVSGVDIAGGLAGTSMGAIANCWCDARVSGDVAGGLVGCFLEDNVGLGYSYWKRTGEEPFDLPAAGNRADEELMGCYPFGAAPGTLDLPPEQEPSTLAQAMNLLIKSLGEVDGIGLYGWSPGTAASYPVMVPLLRVGEEYVEEPFSEGFAHGATLGEAAALVTTYTNANGAATAESLGALLSQADLLGFRLGELAQGNAILDFAPALRVTAFEPGAPALRFQVENGIDATPAQALARLSASTAGRVTVLQKATLGGTATPLDTAVQFAPDHGAASFALETPGDRSFFALSIVPAE